MTKVLYDEKRVNPKGVDGYVGQFYAGLAKDEMDVGNYRSAKRYSNLALRSYEEERAKPHDRSSKSKLAELTRESVNLGRKADTMLKMEQETKNYIAPIRWLLKWVDKWHIFGLFLFSILFSNSTITGNVIGNNEGNFGYIGIIFFFMGIIACYTFLWKKFLIRRYTDKY